MREPIPKVSVIVPCHNAANYLKEALQSALAQQPQRRPAGGELLWQPRVKAHVRS